MTALLESLLTKTVIPIAVKIIVMTTIRFWIFSRQKLVFKVALNALIKFMKMELFTEMKTAS